MNPRELIPPEYWRGYQIGYMEYMQDHRGKTERCHSNASEFPYGDLYLDCGQVDAVGPHGDT
jgi:hypothetical protein